MADIKGMKELLAKLKKLGKEGEESIAVVTEVVAKQIEGSAKLKAPVDLGKLRQDIVAVKVDNLNWKIYANYSGLTPYSAYQEFGTGGLVDLTYLTEAGYPVSVAERFKGASQDRVNLPAQPFLFPAYLEGRVQYIEELKKELEFLTNGV